MNTPNGANASSSASNSNTRAIVCMPNKFEVASYSKLKDKLTSIRALSKYHVPVFGNAKAGPSKTVLMEKDYHELMRHLIERDYFPDLPRMRLQMKIQEALDRGDNNVADDLSAQLVALIKKNLRKERTRGLNITNYVNQRNKTAWKALEKIKTTQLALEGIYRANETPLGEDETPLIRGDEEKQPLVMDTDDVRATHVVQVDGERNVLLNTSLLTLETFHRKFTSEDNNSFREIMDEQQRKRDLQSLWMTQEADKHNMRNLRLRLPREEKLALINPPPRLDTITHTEEIRALVFHDVDKSDSAQKRMDHRVSTGQQDPLPIVLAEVPAATLEKRVADISGVYNATMLRNEEQGYIYNTAVPKTSVFFAPETIATKITEPKMIATASTRMPLSHQIDDVLQTDVLGRQIEQKKGAKRIIDLRNEADNQVDAWLRNEGDIPDGLELLQIGVPANSIKKDEEKGFSFLEEDARELIGIDIANKVLEKKRRERYNVSNLGREERGYLLKEALRTPLSTVFNPESTALLSDFTQTNGPYDNAEDGVHRNLTPLLRNSRIMRKHLRARTNGVLSSRRANNRGSTNTNTSTHI